MCVCVCVLVCVCVGGGAGEEGGGGKYLQISWIRVMPMMWGVFDSYLNRLFSWRESMGFRKALRYHVSVW